MPLTLERMGNDNGEIRPWCQLQCSQLLPVLSKFIKSCTNTQLGLHKARSEGRIMLARCAGRRWPHVTMTCCSPRTWRRCRTPLRSTWQPCSYRAPSLRSLTRTWNVEASKLVKFFVLLLLVQSSKFQL